MRKKTSPCVRGAFVAALMFTAGCAMTEGHVVPEAAPLGADDEIADDAAGDDRTTPGAPADIERPTATDDGDLPEAPDSDLNEVLVPLPDCGDGEIDTPTLPACPDLDEWTDVYDMDDLDAWLADPTTSVWIRRDLDFEGADLVVETGCRFKTRDSSHQINIGDIDIAAYSIDLRSPLLGSGTIDLYAVEEVVAQLCSHLTGTDMTVEAQCIDLRKDVEVASLCAEGDDVQVRQGSTLTIDGGEVGLHAFTDLDVRGDVVGAGDVTMHSDGWLTHRSASVVDVAGDLALSGYEVDLRGDFEVDGWIGVDATLLDFRSSASFEGGLGHGWDVIEWLDWRGKLECGGEVVIESEELLLRSSGRLVDSGDVFVFVNGLLDGRGKIQDNIDVQIVSGSYDLRTSHDFGGNTSCTIDGVEVEGSKPVDGCTPL